MTANLDWLWWLSGALVAAIGLLILFLALFKDRSRGRRRCPKCWYDMAGVPGLRCPECGREAKAERALGRRRRRWRGAGVGAVLLAIGVAGAAWPQYNSREWVRLVPSVILAWWAPLERTGNGASWWTPGGSGQTAPPQGLFGSTFVLSRRMPLPSLGDQLCDEAWGRVMGNEFRTFEARWFVKRYFRQQGSAFDKCVDVPLRWPVGEPLAVRLSSSPLRSLDGLSLEVRAGSEESEWTPLRAERHLLPDERFIGPSDGPASRVRIDLRMIAHGAEHIESFTRPITIKGTLEDFLDQLDSEDVTATVQRALRPRMVDLDGSAAVVFGNRGRQAVWAEIDYAIAYSFEVVLEGRVLGTGAWITSRTGPVWKDWDDPMVTWLDEEAKDCLIAALAAGAGAEIIVRGDPSGATKQYLAHPFDGYRPACWTGEFRMPLEKGERPW